MTPDELQETRDWWRDLIYNENGELDEHKVLAELYDFRHIITEVPKVYEAVTGGQCSKPNYYANSVLRAHELHMESLLQEAQHEAVLEALEMLETGYTKDEIIKEFPNP